MSKLKIEKGASRVRRAPLKATVDGTVADDLELMCEWSQNESSYLVNLLLGFAIAQSEDFQKFKAGRPASSLLVRGVATSDSDPAGKTPPVIGRAPAEPVKGVSA